MPTLQVSTRDTSGCVFCCGSRIWTASSRSSKASKRPSATQGRGDDYPSEFEPKDDMQHLFIVGRTDEK